MSILIKHADYVATVDSRRKVCGGGAVCADGSKIVDVGPTPTVLKKYRKADEVIYGRGRAVCPGFVNTHSHLGQVLLKGLGDDEELHEWIRTFVSLTSKRWNYKNVHASAESWRRNRLLGGWQYSRLGTAQSEEASGRACAQPRFSARL